MPDTKYAILIVDPDPFVAEAMCDLLDSEGYHTAAVSTASAAVEKVDAARLGSGGHVQPFAVMLVDMTLPDMDGLELIDHARKRCPGLVPVAITGYGTIEQAVESIRRGAVDYLTKPIIDEELRVAIEKAIQQHTLRSENTNLRNQLDQRFGLENIVGVDKRMRRVYETIQAVAQSKTTVLMCGESGTGKSLVARAIHRLSPRADHPFVEISCGSIPETLLESELFGHVRGAFTGAHADKVGKFQAAHHGTLFLDEINSASPGMQLKLLRALQERVFEPVGSTETVEVDVRVILASNQPLEDLVASGEFRQDLYYRINVVMLQLPPLRDRLADIELLAEHFLEVKASEAGKRIIGIEPDATDALARYDYPGNVRELENIIERAVVLTSAVRIRREDLPPQVLGGHSSLAAGKLAEAATEHLPLLKPGQTLRDALEEPERQIILQALESNEWNRQRTADQLDINRTTLYKKMKQYGLDRWEASAQSRAG